MASNIIQDMERAIKYDTWGQRLEATEEYQKFLDGYEGAVSKLKMRKESRIGVDCIVKHCKNRLMFLEGKCEEDTEFVGMEVLKADLEGLRSAVALSDRRYRKRQASICSASDQKYLLSAVSDIEPDKTYVVITIDKIAIKEAQTFVDPFISIFIRDSQGELLDIDQSTQPSYVVTQDLFIIFNCKVHIQKPLEELGDDFGIFFEFRHYKEKKNKVSTKCYSIVEKDEIKNGKTVVELYRKPVDNKRKKLFLLTDKPYFLHLIIKVISQNQPDCEEKEENCPDENEKEKMEKNVEILTLEETD